MLYIGVDLGTSAVKLLLMDGSGRIHKVVSREYPLYFPHPAWSEQNPEDWFTASMDGMKELTSECDKSQVAGISFGGQMHGLVTLDQADEVIRPAILWNDGRSEKETDYLNQTIGKEKLSAYTANIAFTGFTAPKILWMKRNEPENFARICRIMLPKDYLAYRLSGSFCTDYSDASGMLLLDVAHKCWSEEMMELCGITRKQLPDLYESYEVVGNLKEELAKELGFSQDVKSLPAQGTMPLPPLEQEPLARDAATFPWVPAEPSLFPVRALRWTATMPFIPLTMRTDISISWDVCSALLPATSGGWRKSLRPRSFPGSRRESLSWVRTMCSICPISWESVLPTTIQGPGHVLSA